MLGVLLWVSIGEADTRFGRDQTAIQTPGLAKIGDGIVTVGSRPEQAAAEGKQTALEIRRGFVRCVRMALREGSKVHLS